jgi:energy-coupling factor transporter ATP-binding protein EcfA2
LDSEQRIITAKVIKRFILHAKKTAFIIEHDFIMATYLADRVIVFEGVPAISATATPYGSFFFVLVLCIGQPDRDRITADHNHSSRG